MLSYPVAASAFRWAKAKRVGARAAAVGTNSQSPSTPRSAYRIVAATLHRWGLHTVVRRKRSDEKNPHASIVTGENLISGVVEMSFLSRSHCSLYREAHAVILEHASRDDCKGQRNQTNDQAGDHPDCEVAGRPVELIQ